MCYQNDLQSNTDPYKVFMYKVANNQRLCCEVHTVLFHSNLFRSLRNNHMLNSDQPLWQIRLITFRGNFKIVIHLIPFISTKRA